MASLGGSGSWVPLEVTIKLSDGDCSHLKAAPGLENLPPRWRAPMTGRLVLAIPRGLQFLRQGCSSVPITWQPRMSKAVAVVSSVT